MPFGYLAPNTAKPATMPQNAKPPIVILNLQFSINFAFVFVFVKIEQELTSFRVQRICRQHRLVFNLSEVAEKQELVA